MEAEIKVIFTQDYKSFQCRSEYILNGNLIIISGINGAGKSQFLEGIKQKSGNVYINGSKISHDNILKYSFKDNITLPAFGAYDPNFVRESNDVIYNIYQQLVGYYKRYVEAKRNNPDNFYMQLGIDSEITAIEYCIENVSASISVKNGNYTTPKKILKPTIAQIADIIINTEDDSWQKMDREELFEKLSESFFGSIKLENDEIEGITRIFTEAARVRTLERDKYADMTKRFDNQRWLKKAPWTEINNLFEKLHFNYRFAKDYEYQIPYLKEEPKLYTYENGKVNKSKTREINDLSDGEKALLKLVVATYDRKEDNATKLLLLDEYDAVLNPSIIKDFYVALREYYLDKNIIVLMTTHSPVTISMAPDDASFYEIFRQNDASPKIVGVNREDYEEFKVLNDYYNKIQNPELRLEEIEGENSRLKASIKNMTKPLIITEGKTDWKHIQKAKERLARDGDYEFFKTEEPIGDDALLRMLQEQSRIGNSNKRIFIFDRDNDDIIKQVIEDGSDYKNWGNNVYSFAIPLPNIRSNEEKISIEHYYPDDILKKEVIFDNGVTRRIYCGDDFQKTGLNLELGKRCNKKCDKGGKGVVGPNRIRVLSGSGDEKVFDIENDDDQSTNYALTKDGFFERIINNDDNDIDMSKFGLILDIIDEIISLSD